MIDFVSTFTYAQQAAAPPGGGMMQLLFPIVLIVAAMYFFIIRPQSRKDKEFRTLLDSLKKGDVVITKGGIYGTVVNLSENDMVLRVDDAVTIKFLRSALYQVVSREGDNER